MSSGDPTPTDAKNRSKNTTNIHFSHVMCFGTFDIFHPGHNYYLSTAGKLAKHMTVVIARDPRVFAGKGRDPVHDEQTRLQGVKKAFPYANVILGDQVDIFAPIRACSPDLLVFGYDQRVPEDKLKELFPHIEIVRIDGFETDKWKSSLLRIEQTKMKDEDNNGTVSL